MDTAQLQPHRTRDELDASLATILAAPADNGTLALIVRRPAVDEREVLDEGQLDPAVGLVGDTWTERSSRRTPDGSPHPDMQLNVMSARVADRLAGDPTRRALAGDQLFVDLDITEANLPPGTRLAIGTAVIEVTEQPHTGCQKFSGRFGVDALRWVNEHPELRLRGLCARVVVAGTVRQGDTVRKVDA
ncbi:MAG TPA: MOSC domain-containing protein [Ilumatobacteraceae bacterium]